MSPAGDQAAPGSAGPLKRAVSYALAVAGAVTPPLLPRPTPCRGWDLHMLLLHAADSVAALTEGIDRGYIGLGPAAGPRGPDDPAQDFRDRARWLLGACLGGQGRAVVSIGGCPMAASVMAAAGALEIAVHGWDISQACGQCQPIPPRLASELLEVAPLLVTAADRYPLFAAPVSVPATAVPSDRLAAFLGRSPWRAIPPRLARLPRRAAPVIGA